MSCPHVGVACCIQKSWNLPCFLSRSVHYNNYAQDHGKKHTIRNKIESGQTENIDKKA